jgi:hypothetical protein
MVAGVGPTPVRRAAAHFSSGGKSTLIDRYYACL